MTDFNAIAKQKISSSFPLSGEIEKLGGKTYVGIKVIHATPMKRIDYLNLRGWTLPANENGEDEGYLVQYADQDNSNLEGFTGYVSWSPKDVFEAAYSPV